jgi:hypothetical protein
VVVEARTLVPVASSKSTLTPAIPGSPRLVAVGIEIVPDEIAMDAGR